MSDLKANKDLLTVYLMIRIYCHAKHNLKENPCNECHNLYEYAKSKLQKCPFIARKTTCAKCKVHCFESAKREQIKKVMKFSGPRMIYRHPILAIRHLSQMLNS